MITEKQIKALKYLISRSKDGAENAKSLLYYLIDQSEGLTKEICLTITEGEEIQILLMQGQYTPELIERIAHDIHDMMSSNGTTYLDEILEAMGTPLHFSLHYGDFDPARGEKPLNTDGQFAGCPSSLVSRPEQVKEGMPTRYTFWLAREHYSRSAILLKK